MVVPEPSSATSSTDAASSTGAAPSTRRVVVLRADATATIGVGHAMRLLALAQELRRRDVAVHLAGDLDVAWVASAYEAAGIGVHPRPTDAAELVDLALRRGAEWCVLDRYDLGAEWGAALRRAGIAVMTMVDGEFSARQDADLYVDQNPGAQPRAVESGRIALAGAAYTLFRDDVLTLRRPAGEQLERNRAAGPLRVLEVFGGTDPCGAAPVVTPIVLAACAGRSAEVTVVTPDAEWARPLAATAPAGVDLRTCGPISDLAARAADCDVVVTASGSSVWELMCLGVPLAVVCVIDNQRPGYDIVTRDDLAVGLGQLAELRHDEASRRRAVTALRAALGDAEARIERAERAQQMLDGRGRARVADALLALRR